MQVLKEKILKDGKVKPGNVLKVDSFLNHQMDINILEEIGIEFKKRFADSKINKILTIEASGIAIACMVAKALEFRLYLPRKIRQKTLPARFILLEFSPIRTAEFMMLSYQKNSSGKMTGCLL